jgi:hypothetical protein
MQQFAKSKHWWGVWLEGIGLMITFNVFSCVHYPCAGSQGVDESTKLEALNQAAPEDHNHIASFPNVSMDQDVELNRMLTKAFRRCDQLQEGILEGLAISMEVALMKWTILMVGEGRTT